MTQPSSGGFNFGGSGQTSTTSGFTFGAPQSSSGGTTSFGLGSVGTGSSTGFGLGGQPASNPVTQSTGLGFVQQATTTSGTAASTGSGFTLGGTGTGTGGGTGFALGNTGTTSTGGFNFGGAPASTAPSTGFTLGLGTGTAATIRPSATPTVTAGGGFTLGGASTATPGLSLLPKTTAAPTTGAPPAYPIGAKPPATTTGVGLPLGGGLKLGTSMPASSSGLQLGTVTATSAGLPLGGVTTTKSSDFASPFGSTTAAASSTTSTTTTVTTEASKQMNYRQLEEAINKWMVELEEQEKIFLQQATQVNAWDRLLVENGEKITHLNSDMERVKVDQQKLDHELDFIRSQQKELEELLVPLEKTMEQLPSISYQQHADLERENTYQLAENIDGQLKRMVQDLKEIIDHLNTTNTGQDSNDPIQQITKILNAHMDSLQWLDQNTALLGRRVEDISKQMEMQRKEQERNFRLVYD